MLWLFSYTCTSLRTYDIVSSCLATYPAFATIGCRRKLYQNIIFFKFSSDGLIEKLASKSHICLQKEFRGMLYRTCFVPLH